MVDPNGRTSTRSASLYGNQIIGSRSWSSITSSLRTHLFSPVQSHHILTSPYSDPSVKRSFCKGCNTICIPGHNARVRVKRMRMPFQLQVRYTDTLSKLQRFMGIGSLPLALRARRRGRYLHHRFNLLPAKPPLRMPCPIQLPTFDNLHP